MQKEVKTRQLATLIFVRSLSVGLIALTSFALVSTHLIFRTINRSFEERLSSAQRLFTETIAQDTLIGADVEVYKKCKAFVDSQPVLELTVVEPTGRKICDFMSAKEDGVQIETPIFFDESNKEVAARVNVKYSTVVNSETKERSLGLLLTAIAFFSLIQFLFSRRIATSISSPIARLSERFATGQIDSIASATDSEQSGIKEVQMLFSSIHVMARKLKDYQAQLVATATQDAMAKTATQVAHDIRSPLAALQSVMSTLQNLPEEERVLMRAAVNRIKDIANNLIEKNRELKAQEKETPATELPSVYLLWSVLDTLLTEKRMQYRTQAGIEIDARMEESSYGLFAEIQSTEFGRVLSNLIDNSVEALEGKGAITVSLTGSDGWITIAVSDNGKGIPLDVLPMLGRRGGTFGKPNGSGLGLYHAKTTVEGWGGHINISSKPGHGTEVTIALPAAEIPSWFAADLKLVPGATVVILDDDKSMHGIWRARLDAMRVNKWGIEVLNFYSPEQLVTWVDEHPTKASAACYLMDFELLGQKLTGLDLIEQLELGARGVLVTSHFDEESVRSGCERLGVRLIPKGVARIVPITIDQK